MSKVESNVQNQDLHNLRRDYLREIRAALELLLRDMQLGKQYKFHYAIDFAAISAYLTRSSDHIFTQVPGELESRTFARRQMALHTLLSPGSRKLLLIPPYAEELDSYLDLLQTSAALADQGLKNFYDELDPKSPYKTKLAEMIEKSLEFKQYLKIREGDGDVSLEVEQAALKAARAYFPELHITLLFLSDEDIRGRLRELLRSDVLLDSDEAIPDCINIEFRGEKTDKWFEQIRTLRNRKRDIATYSDAMACNYIETANQRLNPRQLVVFVAPSKDVEVVLSQSKLISVDGENITAVRNLTYCMLAYVLKDEKQVEESLKTVRLLLGIYDSAIPFYLRKGKEQMKTEWEKAENLLLLADSSLTDFEKSGRTLLPGEKKFLELVAVMHGVTKEAVKRAIREELAEMQKQAKDFTEQNHTTLTVKKLREIKFEKEKGKFRLMPALNGELPFPIFFKDNVVGKLAKSLGELHENTSEDDILISRRKVLTDAISPDARPEHHLLADYILAIEGRYEPALAELEERLKQGEGSVRVEQLLLCSTLHRKLYHGKDASDLLEKAIQIDPKDLRVRIELAKALWMKWMQQTDPSSHIQLLDDAIQLLAIASVEPEIAPSKVLRLIDDDPLPFRVILRIQVDNVFAFVLTERALHSQGDQIAQLSKAQEHIDMLSQLLKEGRWLPRFWDTRAYLRYAWALLMTPIYSEKKTVLESALADSRKSTMGAKPPDPALDVRFQHQKLITSYLAVVEAKLQEAGTPPGLNSNTRPSIGT